MSYILDALRRADAERERGHVPGVHAQPSFGAIPVAGTPGGPRPWLWLGAGALAMSALGAALWFAFGNGSTGPASVATAPAPAAPVVAPIAPPAVAQAAAPAPAPAPAPALAPAAIASPAAPAAAAARKPRPAPAPPTQPAPITAAATPPAAATPAAATPSAGAERVYALNELPEEIRRQLPAVTVGGSMYSTAPANRVLILNGQVLHEGDRVAPELTLQQIRLKAAVLNFRGYRYAIAF